VEPVSEQDSHTTAPGSFGADGIMETGLVVDVAVRLRTLLQRPLPADELLENTRAVATPPEARDRLDASLLIVTLGDERLALNVSFTRRVVPVRPIHRVPHRTNELFAGICSVQGELLPVVRLDRLLGIVRHGDVKASEQRMVVVGAESNAWAFIVDGVEGIRRFDSSTFIPPPSTVSRAMDGATDALVPLDGSTFAARLEPDKLLRALGGCVS
jgi:chemotaxis-related protein WspD